MLSAGYAEAQVLVDYTKGHLTWNQQPTTASPDAPTSYVVYCGTKSGGPYTVSKSYPLAGDETVTGGSVLLSDLISSPGIYFCVVTAQNIGGGSPNSTEVTFQGINVPVPAPVKSPAAPTGVTVKGN